MKRAGKVGKVPGAKAQREVVRAEQPELNERQRIIVELVASGLVNKEIASALEVSTSTVALELRLLYARVGVSRRAALVARLWGAQVIP